MFHHTMKHKGQGFEMSGTWNRKRNMLARYFSISLPLSLKEKPKGANCGNGYLFKWNQVQTSANQWLLEFSSSNLHLCWAMFQKQKGHPNQCWDPGTIFITMNVCRNAFVISSGHGNLISPCREPTKAGRMIAMILRHACVLVSHSAHDTTSRLAGQPLCHSRPWHSQLHRPAFVPFVPTRSQVAVPDWTVSTLSLKEKNILNSFSARWTSLCFAKQQAASHWEAIPSARLVWWSMPSIGGWNRGLSGVSTYLYGLFVSIIIGI